MSTRVTRAPRPVRHDVAAAALAVFLAKGYDRATVREIADRAGLRVSSLYAHIGSKEELFIGLIRPVLELGIERIESVVQCTLPPDEKLRRACMIAGELYDLHPEVAIYLSSYSAETGKVVPHLMQRGKDAWRRLVADCLGDPEPDPHDLTVITYGILGMFSWMHRWYRRDGGLTGEEIGARYADVLLAGLSGRIAQGATART